MFKMLCALGCLVALGGFSPQIADAEESWNQDQQTIIEAISRLSAATAPGGGGAEAYGAVLAQGFTRWTLGSERIETKADLVDGVRGWFEDGWRVPSREQEFKEILIAGDTGYVRRIVEETYLGPEGESSTARAALSEVWVRQNGSWLLYRVNLVQLD